MTAGDRPSLDLIRSLKALAASAADDPLALAQTARALSRQGAGEEARAAVRRAVGLAPDDPRIRLIAAEVMSAGIPRWHFRIVRDQIRNRAYDAALRRAVRPGMRVLDIGAGTGLLAMMAARAGAAHVVTCEQDPAVAEAATRVVAANGLSDRVQVIAKHSSALDAERDCGGRFDLVVSEIVSNTILTQRALEVMDDALARLLAPGALVIPARGQVRVALARDEALERERMGVIDGFDLSAFNEFATPSYHLSPEQPRLQLKSAPADLFDFDFRAPPAPARASATLTAEEDGANCIAQWIRLEMDDEGRYENAPGQGTPSCWAVQVHPLARTAPARGDRVVVEGAHDRRSLQLWQG